VSEDETRPADAADEATAAETGAPASADQKLEDEVARLKDQLLRTAADFDNFRKRTRREVEDARSRGRNETLTELLPVFDNLLRAAQHAGTATDVSAIRSGIDMVMSQLESALSRIGITPIPTVGQLFDPTRHDAIQQVERPDVAPGTIVEEVQRGYASGERLVRAALVVVARAPAKSPENMAASDGKGE
jgi:molecular chaperone GrpE